MEEKISEAVLKTDFGTVRGRKLNGICKYLGIPYAKAERFAYAEPIDSREGVCDAGSFGPACPQYRQWFPHLDVPQRLFYYREFREGLEFAYGEDCLNLNIYMPEQASDCPVLLFFYGGGFNSGCSAEEPFRGYGLARRGIVSVFANYRVGMLGYLTHRELRDETGRDGNFGLDDQLCALRWVRAHIADFGGDPDNVTLLGQSAGAISVQYLCLNPDHRGLFRRAAMMSGAGLFPRFALPRRAEDTHGYWLEYIEAAGCRSLDELRRAPLDTLFEAVERMHEKRRDGIYHTMPVVDGLLLPAPVDELIRSPLPLDYLLGFTNADMYAPVMAFIGQRYARGTDAYVYYFDLDAPGDNNAAFHSSDLRYMFGTLAGSWRPYGARDYEASAQMTAYLANFARCGDPNGPGLPRWERAGKNGRALRIGPRKTAMGRVDYGKLVRHMLTKGDPKA